MTITRVGVLLLCLFAHVHQTRAQDPSAEPTVTSPGALVRVFLDCDRCDRQFVTENVAFVDYVRDREVADVHILVTTQGTGGGGTAWTVALLGNGRFQDQNRTLTFSTDQTATDDDRRRAFVRTLRMGLVSYAAETLAAPQLEIAWTRPDGQGQTSSENDPWNYWVFNVGAGGNKNGEATYSNYRYYFNGSANRTTDAWKLQLGANGNRNGSSFELSGGRTVESRSTNWNANSLVVKSLDPRWSLGGQVNAWHSSFSNEDLVVRVRIPTVEFNVFPYSESTRRRLIFRYALAVDVRNYREVTIYDRTSEVVPATVFNAALDLRQPWGELSGSLEYSDHLNHSGRSRTQLRGEADVRLFKGFSFDTSAQYTRSRDMISLRKGSASTEDVLLRVQQIASGYSYRVDFGVGYRFGSIFNNVVNPRFDN